MGINSISGKMVFEITKCSETEKHVSGKHSWYEASEGSDSTSLLFIESLDGAGTMFAFIQVCWIFFYFSM